MQHRQHVVPVCSDTPQRGDALTSFLLFAVFGVAFEFEPRKHNIAPSLEVVLAERRTDTEPENAEYIADSSQDGGGTTDERSRPSAPFTAPDDTASDGIAPQPVKASSLPTQTAQQADAVTRIFSDYQLLPEKDAVEHTQRPEHPVADREQRELEIARLTAEVNDSLEKLAQRPKKKFLTARTKEASAAAYMLAWVQQVERIGNLHYPALAQQSELNGSLIMVVSIDRDGKLLSSEVVKSSGSGKLDAVALEIVQMASPFQAFSRDLARESDIVYITRTWKFDNNRLTGAS